MARKNHSMVCPKCGKQYKLSTLNFPTKPADARCGMCAHQDDLAADRLLSREENLARGRRWLESN